MKKHELVSAIAKKTGVTNQQANDVIDAMSNIIVSTVRDEQDEVNLPILGKFKPKINAARKGINPLTKTVIDIKESHTIKFTPSSALKKVIEPAKPKAKGGKK